jgi:recombination protein RecA
VSDRNGALLSFLNRAREGAVAGGARAAAVISMDAMRVGAEPSTIAPGWSRDQLAGRLVELSGVGATAVLSIAIGLVRGAQEQAEPVVWIALPSACFYPPDAADNGIDLEALVVVRVADAAVAARAAERLLRSGAFGLIVIDLGAEPNAEVPAAHQGRLVTLAQQHDAAIVFVTEKPAEASSLGSLISLRGLALRVRRADGGFACTVRALKDKRRGPGWAHEEVLRAPPGLE